MTTISHREMRNQSGAVLRGAERGESFTVTRRGAPVARIVPLDDAASAIRRARCPALFSEDDLVHTDLPTSAILSALRGDR